MGRRYCHSFLRRRSERSALIPPPFGISRRDTNGSYRRYLQTARCFRRVRCPAHARRDLPFFFMSIKSRVFNPLDNSRPDKTDMAFGERVRPSWTPPGIFFPIMWVLIIAPLRAYSTSLIFGLNGGILCDPTILTLMFHLTIGDVWNTINNNESRLGASVTGVICVWASVLFAASQYYAV